MMQDKNFEWDDKKSESNFTKHGIDFDYATRLFEGDFYIAEDNRLYTEKRYNAYGYIDDLLFCVTFTLRLDAIRIISARRAHLKELNKIKES